MSQSMQAMFDLRTIEDLAYQDSFLKQRHSVMKILGTLAFIIKVTSTDPLQVMVLAKLLLLLAVTFYLGHLPWRELSKRTLPGMLLVAFFGLSFYWVYPLALASLYFFAILLKAHMTIMIALVLVASTGMEGIGEGLLWLKVPRLIVLQLQLTYRYLGRFLDRVAAMSHSYRMRSQGKGIGFEAWGSFLGHLFLGAMADAKMVQQAMALRGFHVSARDHELKNPNGFEWVLLGLCLLLIFL